MADANSSAVLSPQLPTKNDATSNDLELPPPADGDSPPSPRSRISLKLKDTEIAKLRRERDEANAALDKMREKNKLLVAILTQAETKEKAQIIAKIEKMKAVG